MKQNQKRILIAEACGWKGISNLNTGYAPWRREAYEQRIKACSSADLDSIPLDPLPDYFSDLNAMHQAEKAIMDPFLWNQYENNVADVMKYTGWICHVSASQRAEAFGITLNLWNSDS